MLASLRVVTQALLTVVMVLRYYSVLLHHLSKLRYRVIKQLLMSRQTDSLFGAYL